MAITGLEQAIEERQRQHRSLIAGLARGLRRLRQFEGEGQWSAALADAAALGASRVLVFACGGDRLRLLAASGFPPGVTLPDMPVSQAAALAAAAQSLEPIVALKTVGELSPEIASLVGEDPSGRFAVYPVTVLQRAALLVYAEAADGDLLDVVTSAAGTALECHLAATGVLHRGSGGGGAATLLSSIAPASGMAFLSRDQEEQHLRAQRFARVQAAEIRLYHSQAVKTGRAEKNIYGLLRQPIDEARRTYREQYLAGDAHLPDYVHQEIVKTLAHGNAELLGPDYPGPLV